MEAGEQVVEGRPAHLVSKITTENLASYICEELQGVLTCRARLHPERSTNMIS